jgi:EAL domain-containing protein (putative c-di-GMP-specific phosphodiesterase class I)
MYMSKRLRSPIELYNSEHDSSSRDSLILRGQVRQAVDDGSLTAHFQPKVEVDSGLIVGVEALARWQHPTRGVVLPDVFLSLVDKAGQMNALTDRVLELAVHQAAAWKRAGMPIGVAVNIEVSSLADPLFASSVARRLDEAGLPGDLLTLEITETCLMADPVRARRVAEELAAIGVRLSIDDFGTGYSSLGHLTALPLSELKIDRSFVYRMAHSRNDMTIVRTILDLGARLDLSVVAEGIETPAMRTLVSGLGCKLAQGYEFGSPVAAEALTRVLPSRLASRAASASTSLDPDPLPLPAPPRRDARCRTGSSVRYRQESRRALNGSLATGSPNA